MEIGTSVIRLSVNMSPCAASWTETLTFHMIIRVPQNAVCMEEVRMSDVLVFRRSLLRFISQTSKEIYLYVSLNGDSEIFVPL